MVKGLGYRSPSHSLPYSNNDDRNYLPTAEKEGGGEKTVIVKLAKLCNIEFANEIGVTFS